MFLIFIRISDITTLVFVLHRHTYSICSFFCLSLCVCLNGKHVFKLFQILALSRGLLKWTQLKLAFLLLLEYLVYLLNNTLLTKPRVGVNSLYDRDGRLFSPNSLFDFLWFVESHWWNDTHRLTVLRVTSNRVYCEWLQNLRACLKHLHLNHWLELLILFEWRTLSNFFAVFL